MPLANIFKSGDASPGRRSRIMLSFDMAQVDDPVLIGFRSAMEETLGGRRAGRA